MTRRMVEWKGYTQLALCNAFEKDDEHDSAAIGRIALGCHGNFAALRMNSDSSITLLTDHSGSIPLYYGMKDGRISVGWKPREVAKDLGSPRIDPVSAADFVINETVCYPYTLFKDVFLAPPGAVTRIAIEGICSEVYYRPEEGTNKGSVEDWGERLREGMRSALLAGLEGCRSAKVLYSGGEDARSVVSLLPVDFDCELVTLADIDNREVKLARRAARVQGRRFVYRKRPPDFYRKDIHARSRLINGGFDIRHTHIYGATAVGLDQTDALIGGYMADGLFKSLWMVNVDRSLRRLGPERLASRGEQPLYVQRIASESRIREEIVDKVNERRKRHHESLKEFRHRTAANWHPLWPLGGQQPLHGHYLATLAIGPRVVEPFMDSQVYRIAASMPEQFRVDRKVFRNAFAPPLGWAGLLPSSSGRIPCLNGHIGHWVQLGSVLKRKVSDSVRRIVLPVLGQEKHTQGPWSDDVRGWDMTASETLDAGMCEELSLVLGKIFKPSAFVMLEDQLAALQLEERFRAVQIGHQIVAHSMIGYR